MKKRFLAIIILGLLFSGNAYAKCISGDCKNGQGTFKYPDGAKYVGENKNSKPNGQGTYTWADGVKYVGEWKKGKQNGQGTFTYSNGEKYVGENKNDKAHGQGTHTWADGAKYVGEFKNGKRHGQGTLTETDGTKDVGIWKDDKLIKKQPIKNIDYKKSASPNIADELNQLNELYKSGTLTKDEFEKGKKKLLN